MGNCPLRYAVYFTPAEADPLTRAAVEWLGRDAFSGWSGKQPEVEGIDKAMLAALTADPRRYGFHATLKAPFHLKDGETEDRLMAAFADFCGATPAFTIPEAVVRQHGPFFALVPATLHPPLQDFAADIVRHFEPFRAPLSEADIARRNPEKLSPSRYDNLMRWGYPSVMEEFRFHMTLTGPVDDVFAAPMQRILAARFAAFDRRPLVINGLAVFQEEERGAPFTVKQWLPLAGA